MYYDLMNIVLEDKLKEYFGFDKFRNGQEEVISKILQGNSVAAIFPTGAGKSMCYQLPAMILPNLTIVVSPLISLMHDQQDFLSKKNIPSAVLDSTLSRDDYQLTLHKAISGELKILMISVERFKNERFRAYLDKMTISLLVVDEAHCISEWGHNFRPEYLKLTSYVKEFNIPQTLLLTATATEDVAKDMCSKLSINADNCIKTGFYRENLHLTVTPINNENKSKYLAEKLMNHSEQSSVVYVTLQKTAEEVAGYLSNNGVNAVPYHAGLKSDLREDIQNRFMSGDINCVVATIAFGMGIDKSNIRAVYHYDLPKSIENYSQEIGRAGRDGEVSNCEVLASLDGVNVLENFIYGDTPTLESIKALLKVIESQNNIWELKTNSLSYDVNIRQLPLKTLLVYLEIMGIISSSYTYFDEYQFKTTMTGKEILSKFDGERRDFLSSLLRYTEKKRTWITVKLSEFIQDSGCNRSRAISALEYLDSQNLIELSAKQSIEVYKIHDSNIDLELLSNKLFNLFKDKENHEIERIKRMIDFFQSENCLSRGLAMYFGEKLEENCNSCSVCNGEIIKISDERQSSTIPEHDITELISEFASKAKSHFTVDNITKFLCGINTPVFTKIKAKKIYGWASLEQSSYKNVKEAISEILNC